MKITALSPWAEPACAQAVGIAPRLDTLDGKTIGMFASFKEVAVSLLKELAAEMQKHYPNTKFKFLQYREETREVRNNPAFEKEFKAWIEDVDAVVTAYGDFSSCSMFLAYDAAYIERLGIPTVMLVRPDLIGAAERGARARMVPGTRYVNTTIGAIPGFPLMTPAIEQEYIRPYMPALVEPVVKAITEPATQEEMNPAQPDLSWSKITVTGTAEEIRWKFYEYGWTNGMPIVPPTEEAVAEMLRGTDLPRDYVVAEIPPMNGKATVEKIAINAVMAGCLPTHMPVLIAAAKGMVDSRIALEGWTCSMSSWGPVIAVSGPVASQININSKGNYLSPYYVANAAIAKAFAYLIMNIGGTRPQLEDMSELGHENRFGLCIADNDENNPWPAFHTDYGFAEGDSVVTLFWPQEHKTMGGTNPGAILDSLVSVSVGGWDPGAMFIMSPKAAKVMADAGWSRKRLRDYIVEYNRKPGAQVPVSWLIANNHPPSTVDIPQGATHSSRSFWSDDHMTIMVGGSTFGTTMVALTGGGDHGGPSYTKIELPKNWEELTKEYDIRPNYIPY